MANCVHRPSSSHLSAADASQSINPFLRNDESPRLMPPSGWKCSVRNTFLEVELEDSSCAYRRQVSAPDLLISNISDTIDEVALPSVVQLAPEPCSSPGVAHTIISSTAERHSPPGVDTGSPDSAEELLLTPRPTGKLLEECDMTPPNIRFDDLTHIPLLSSLLPVDSSATAQQDLPSVGDFMNLWQRDSSSMFSDESFTAPSFKSDCRDVTAPPRCWQPAWEATMLASTQAAPLSINESGASLGPCKLSLSDAIGLVPPANHTPQSPGRFNPRQQGSSMLWPQAVEHQEQHASILLRGVPRRVTNQEITQALKKARVWNHFRVNILRYDSRKSCVADVGLLGGTAREQKIAAQELRHRLHKTRIFGCNSTVEVLLPGVGKVAPFPQRNPLHLR